ncbi:MAG: polyphosphate polymerase domain-containing protein [Anaerolineaceae bacterium]
MIRPLWMKTTEDQPRYQPWMVAREAWICDPTPHGLALQAEDFDPISLSEMEGVALLNRIDTKFIMTTRQLLKALEAIQSDYRILCIEGHRLHHYRTLYFDTPDFKLYNLHVNDRADRYKVRCREYVDSNKAFWEVKHKTRKDRTIKDRIPAQQPLGWMDASAETWLHDALPYDSQELEPKIWNDFTRITLVRKQCCERVTLDVNLNFYTEGKEVHLSDIVVAEVKMDSNDRKSPFLLQMRTQRIRPQGFSKYCLGVSMLYEDVKKNSMKPKMLWIEKLTKGMFDYE